MQISTFRNDPAKSVLQKFSQTPISVDWKMEPVVSGYRRLLFEDPRDGNKIPVPICSTPAIIAKVGVVVAGYDGRVSLFSLGLEKLYWQYKLLSPIYASIVVDHKRECVIVASTSGTIASISLRGHVVWTATLKSPVYATPAILPEQDLLAVACYGKRFAGIDLGDGRIIFDTELPKAWFADVAPAVAFRDPYASPVVTPDGHLLICAADTVSAFNSVGQTLWTKRFGHTIRSSPVVLNDCEVIVIASVNGCCTFLDCSTGATMGMVKLGDKVTASLAGTGTFAIVGTANGKVFGLDGTTRAIVWSEPYGAPVDHSSFTVLPDGSYMCTNVRGNIVARSRDSGSFLWETSQLLGITEHEPRLDITPIACSDGVMYCASYTGALYEFAFRHDESSVN